MPARTIKIALFGGTLAMLPLEARAQETQQLPEVEVPQTRPPARPAPAARPAPRPAARAPVQAVTVPVAPPPPPPPPGPVRGVDGRVIDPAPALSPNNQTSILPHDLSTFTGAGSRLTTQEIDEDRPLDAQNYLTRVPGVAAVSDDGLGRHINVGIRGAPVRRSRKVLMLEDGQSINFSTYIDPSTHYSPPIERIESIEVIRGGTVAFGPLTNHGVINFRNLSPFGAPETVITAAFGNNDFNRRHVHTRQQAENVGVVLSYTGMDSDGVFDLERLRYNDFYGAVGWKGSKQDLTVSGLYFRQRDNYDERNLLVDEFRAHPRCKRNPCMMPLNPNDPDPDEVAESRISRQGNQYNTYNADLVMGQVVHNYYFNEDTTLNTRFYGYEQDRARFESRAGGINNPEAEAFGMRQNMRGRDRLYQHYGAATALELANRPFVGGMRQDLQMGIRTEYHEFRNCNSAGRSQEKLDWDNRGNCFAIRGQPAGAPFQDDGRLELYDAMTYAGFIQSAVHLTDALTVVPGIRFESWDLKRDTIWAVLEDPRRPAPGLPNKESKDYNEALPAISFSWGFGRIVEREPYSAAESRRQPQFNTTFYGGYNRGLGIPVARGAAIQSLEPEIGDNFQIGVRSTAIRGITLDAALFHSTIDDYQIKEAQTDDLGNNIFTAVNEVEIEGAELYTRLDTLPYWETRLSGHRLNLFGEATFTYAHSEITEDIQNPAIVGNLLPEVPREMANLTAGIELGDRFNASVTWTYRGSFFTDVENNVGIVVDAPDEVVPIGGEVRSVWLLSARANYNVPNTPLTLFVSGQNLEDKLYVADIQDGLKPGMGRTIWGGFTLKWGGERQALLDNSDGYGGYR